MINDDFFINSNMEYENSCIYRGKIIKPPSEYSKDSENYKNQEINIYNNNNNSNLHKEYFKPISISYRKYDREKKQKENGKEFRNINIQNKSEYSHELSVNELLKPNNKAEQNNNKDGTKKYNHNERQKINLPTNAKEFLEYFDIYLDKIKEALYIQQQAFILFKIPYLYSPIKKDLDNINENMKKIDWKQKFKFKSYLLHAKLKYSLIINGKSIDYCISEGETSELFWFLIMNSRSIICSQCLPIQKSKIVEFVKRHTKDITLAIGDGENDVNMIKTAHIGIGLFGKEGCQAAFNSDYAFYQFKYLKRLLFNNGRFSLLRNTYFLNMYFFKNLFYTIIPIIFTFFSLFSGTFFYEEFYDSMFNTFISIIPLIVFSINDEDIDLDFEKYNEKKKKWLFYLLTDLYKQARDSKPFNIVKYLICTFISIVYALLMFSFDNYIYIHMIKNHRGEIITYDEFSFNIYFSVIFIHFFMVYIDTSLFNLFVFIFFFAQILADSLFVIILNNIGNDNKLKILQFNASFLTLIINCAACCLPFYILRRAELFFGIKYSNLIKINKLEAIYLGNYYKKEVQRMIRATRAIAKFKRIHKEIKSDKKPDENENLNDRKYRKIIEKWEEKNVKAKRNKKT